MTISTIMKYYVNEDAVKLRNEFIETSIPILGRDIAMDWNNSRVVNFAILTDTVIIYELDDESISILRKSILDHLDDNKVESFLYNMDEFMKEGRYAN